MQRLSKKGLASFFLLHLICSLCSAQIHTVASGNWNNNSVWSTGVPPGSMSGGVNVIIRHAVTVPNNPFNVVIGNLTIENGTAGLPATLSFNSGTSARTLTINGDLVITGTTENDCRIQLQGSSTSCSVGGNISVTRNHPGVVNNFGISVRDGSSMTGNGNLTINYLNSADDAQEIYVRETSSFVLNGDVSIINSGGAEEASINVIDNGFFQCNNLNASLEGDESPSGVGRDLELLIHDNGQMIVNGDMNISRTGGRHLALEVGDGTTANASLTIGGDLSIEHLNGVNLSNKDFPVTIRGLSTMSVNGNLSAVSNSARALTFNLHNNCVLTVTGDVTLTGSTNTNLTMSANNTARIFFGGDIETNYPAQPNASAFTFSSVSPDISTVTFNGSANQTVPAETYGNLVINNSFQVTAAGNITVTNALNLTQGKLLAPGLTVTLANTASITGSASSYICNGTVVRALNLGAGPYWFHTGSVEKGYSPVSLSNLSAASSFRVSYYPINPATATSPGPYDPTLKASPLEVVSHGEFWMIDRIAGTGSARVMLGWNAESDVNDAALGDLIIARWDGSEWYGVGTCSYTGNATAGQLTTDLAVSNFSPFTLSSLTLNNPLPVTLSEFAAHPESGVVIVTWKTNTELNNDHFVIERSKDGTTFEPIGHIEGKRNSTKVVPYNFRDLNPLPCRSYYRLKQVDLDGKIQLLKTASVNRASEDKTEFFPNPVSLHSHEPVQIYLPLCDNEETIRVVIFDSLGRMRWTSGLSGNPHQLRFYPSELALERGIYSVRIVYPSGSFTTSFVVN